MSRVDGAGAGPRCVEEYARIVYWTCNVFGHRHKDEPSAHLCMMKRKGEIGYLKKLRRNLAMIAAVRAGEPIVSVGYRFACSDTNVIKAINSTLRRAYGLSKASPYPVREWRRVDLMNAGAGSELEWLIGRLKELESKLGGMV